MTRFYSQTEVLALIGDLTEQQLGGFLGMGIVMPAATPQGPVFTEADVARLQLICDLAECYRLDEDALRLILSLIDELSLLRGDMRALMAAVADQPEPVRGHIRRTISRIRVRVTDIE